MNVLYTSERCWLRCSKCAIFRKTVVYVLFDDFCGMVSELDDLMF